MTNRAAVALVCLALAGCGQPARSGASPRPLASTAAAASSRTATPPSLFAARAAMFENYQIQAARIAQRSGRFARRASVRGRRIGGTPGNTAPLERRAAGRGAARGQWRARRKPRRLSRHVASRQRTDLRLDVRVATSSRLHERRGALRFLHQHRVELAAQAMGAKPIPSCAQRHRRGAPTGKQRHRCR